MPVALVTHLLLKWAHRIEGAVGEHGAHRHHQRRRRPRPRRRRRLGLGLGLGLVLLVLFVLVVLGLVLGLLGLESLGQFKFVLVQ